MFGTNEFALNTAAKVKPPPADMDKSLFIWQGMYGQRSQTLCCCSTNIIKAIQLTSQQIADIPALLKGGEAYKEIANVAGV